MSTPLLFLGSAAGGVLLEADQGTGDNAAAFNLLARTNRVAPAGVGGECIFTALYLAISHTEAATLRVTPILDGVALEPTDIALPLVAARTLTAHDVGISIPYTVAAVEAARFAARGTWLQVQVETLAAAPGDFGDLIIESVEVEYEVVRETKDPAP